MPSQPVRSPRMSPSHTKKGGARYRYYVSQAVLQNRPAAAASITRVPAAEIEALVIMALRNHLQVNATEAQSALGNERKLVEHHLERVTLAPKRINLQLRPIVDVVEARS
jgi:site-specific DNA recombinase